VATATRPRTTGEIRRPRPSPAPCLSYASGPRAPTPGRTRRRRRGHSRLPPYPPPPTHLLHPRNSSDRPPWQLRRTLSSSLYVPPLSSGPCPPILTPNPSPRALTFPEFSAIPATPRLGPTTSSSPRRRPTVAPPSPSRRAAAIVRSSMTGRRSGGSGPNPGPPRTLVLSSASYPPHHLFKNPRVRVHAHTTSDMLGDAGRMRKRGLMPNRLIASQGRQESS
jgi:hypothetical protein